MDHSRASRLAHGAVYATYVGTWRKRFRITAGEREITRFEEKETGAVRSFCRCCGTPLIYERTSSRHMINIPRALFQTRTGRQGRADARRVIDARLSQPWTLEFLVALALR